MFDAPQADHSVWAQVGLGYRWNGLRRKVELWIEDGQKRNIPFPLSSVVSAKRTTCIFLKR